MVRSVEGAKRSDTTVGGGEEPRSETYLGGGEDAATSKLHAIVTRLDGDPLEGGHRSRVSKPKP